MLIYKKNCPHGGKNKMAICALRYLLFHIYASYTTLCFDVDFKKLLVRAFHSTEHIQSQSFHPSILYYKAQGSFAHTESCLKTNLNENQIVAMFHRKPTLFYPVYITNTLRLCTCKHLYYLKRSILN